MESREERIRFCIAITLWSILLFVSSCTKDELPKDNPYLDLMEVNWQCKEWVLDGDIEGKTIIGTRTTDAPFNVYDEERDAISSTVGLRVFYQETRNENNPTIPENVSLFMFYCVDYIHKTLELRKVINGYYLADKAFVRFLPGKTEGNYILQVDYEGKSYELRGYPKD